MAVFKFRTGLRFLTPDLLLLSMPTVPVIIYNSHYDPIVEREGRAAGASAVISKAEPIAVLLAVARHLLNPLAA